MCQGADRRLCNLSQRCHVRKVARLLARPLRRRARQLAASVCGWEIDRGRYPEEIDRERHNAALYVTRRTQEGASYEDILHELQAAPGFLKEMKKRRNITLEDVENLGALRLGSPER
jgi:hypothetical protein